MTIIGKNHKSLKSLKKILLISGIAAVFLLVFLLTGIVDAGSDANKALQYGNRQYASGVYEEALKLYETALEANPENKTLNFNAAQSAYQLGEYNKAAMYYVKAESNEEKFLNFGNASLMLAVASEDANQKADYYVQALKAYYDGIVLYPQDVRLKYNYEALKEKIEEQIENQEQDSSNQSDGDESQENQENQETQEHDSQNQEAEEQDGQNQEESDSSHSQEQEGHDEESGQGEDDENNSTENEGGVQEQEDGEDGEDDPDRLAIERILRMLENQEEYSLKNNQEVMKGKDDKYGW